MELSKLKRGQKGQIISISDHRFREFGLLEGVEIEMVQPGKTSIIRLQSSTVAIRGCNIEVSE